ncbi:MAG: iron-containing alcohol dehydrogenase, partial [Eggerthellaceae bacterium]|nr:iron-containing alcohol dehydrogenase [Eggerthellaceae bacterium]
MTGMDALCYAVESYTNATYMTRFENQLAERAVRFVFDNIMIAYEDGVYVKA